MTGALAKTTGRANEETTNAIVIKIASSMVELVEPVLSVYLRANNVGTGANK